MKKFVYLVFVLLAFGLLSACSTDDDTSDTDKKEIVDEVDEEEKEEEEEVDPFEHLTQGDITKLSEAMEQAQQHGELVQQLSMYQTVLFEFYMPGLDVTTTSESYVFTQLDLEEFYLYQEVDTGIEYLNPEPLLYQEHNGTIYLFTRTENDYIDVISYGSADSLEIQNQILSNVEVIDMDTEYFMDVETISDTEFAGVLLPETVSLLFGDEFFVAFTDVNGLDLSKELLNFNISFTNDYTEYELLMYYPNLTGDIAGEAVEITFELSLIGVLGEFEKNSSLYENNTVAAADSVENTIFTYSGERGYNVLVKPNQSNFMKYELEAGIYRTSIEEYMMDNVTVYDSQMNEIEVSHPFIVDETEVFYVDIQTSYRTSQNFFIIKMDITDVSYLEYDTVTQGTVSGYSEGPEDINQIQFKQQEREYIVIVDVDTTVFSGYTHRFGLRPNTQRGYSAPYCNSDYRCAFYLEDTQDLILRVYSKEPTQYAFTYRFIEFDHTESNLDNVDNIYDFDHYSLDVNPVVMDLDQPYAYFKITIDTYGKYDFYQVCNYGMCSYFDQVLYDSSGNEIVLDGMNGDYLEPGDYIVKYFYEYDDSRFNVFVPVLIHRTN